MKGKRIGCTTDIKRPERNTRPTSYQYVLMDRAGCSVLLFNVGNGGCLQFGSTHNDTRGQTDTGVVGKRFTWCTQKEGGLDTDTSAGPMDNSLIDKWVVFVGAMSVRTSFGSDHKTI